jgi:hypothetical protein
VCVFFSSTLVFMFKVMAVHVLVLLIKWTVLTFGGLISNFLSQHKYTHGHIRVSIPMFANTSHITILSCFCFFIFVFVVIIVTSDDDLLTFFELQNGCFRYCIDPHFFPSGFREYHLIFCKATGLWKQQKIILDLS